MASALELYREAINKSKEASNLNVKAVPTKSEVKQSNFLQQLGGTMAHLNDNIITGASKGLEGIVDAGASIVGTVGSWFGADTSGIQNFINTDYTTQFKNSTYGKGVYNALGGGLTSLSLLGNLPSVYDSKSTDLSSAVDNVLSLRESSIDYSWVNNLDTQGQDIFNAVTESIGQMLPSIAVGGVASGAGLGSKAVKALSMGTFGGGTMGNSVQEGLNNGNDLQTATAYGALEGIKEVGTELLGDKLFGSKVLGVFGNGSSNVGKQSLKSVLKEFGKQAIGEGAEEVIGDVLDPLIKKTTIDKDKSLTDLYSDSISQMPMDFITGALTGAIMNGGTVLSDVSTYGIEGSRVKETISEANSTVEEIVKLEKSKNGINDSNVDTKIKELQSKLVELNNDYTEQMNAVKEHYGLDSKKSNNISSFENVMNDMSTSSSQDLTIRDTIEKYNKKNKSNVGYTALNQKDFDTIHKEVFKDSKDTNSSNNAFIFEGNNIVVNKDSEAYKSGKLFSTIGHEFIHRIEGTEGYTELYNTFTNSLTNNNYNDKIEEYKKLYGNNRSQKYLLQEAFADYIGENISLNYKEFSNMLGTSSKLSNVLARLKGYRSSLSIDNKNIQSNVRSALEELKEANKSNKNSAYDYQQKIKSQTFSKDSISKINEVAKIEENTNEEKTKKAKEKVQTPLDTDSNLAFKFFANLTQSKVYNKADVVKSINAYADVLEKSIGTNNKVDFKGNKAKIADKLFKSLNTQVNNDIESIAFELSNQMLDINVNDMSLKDYLNTLDEGAYEELSQYNIELFNNLLSKGKTGKVASLKNKYNRIIENLKNRLHESINYEREIKKTIYSVKKLVENHASKNVNNTSSFSPVFAEFKSIIDSFDSLLNRNDYIKADFRSEVSNIKGLIKNNKFLIEEGYVTSELMEELDYLTRSEIDGSRAKLSLEEMKSLRKVIAWINKVYREYDIVLLNGKKQIATDIATKGLEDMTPKKNFDKNVLAKAKVDKFVNAIGQDPRTKLTYMQSVKYENSTAQTIMNELEYAENKKLGVKQDLLSGLEKINNKRFNKLSNKSVSINGTSLTDSQAITLYMTSQRGEVALRHIYGEGIKLQLGNNKFTEIKNITETDIDNVRKYVESNYADIITELKTLYYEKSQKYYNETLEARTGYTEDLEDKYFPLYTDSKDFNSSVGTLEAIEVGYREFLSPSFTKKLNNNANNAVVIKDILSLTYTYANQLSTYAGITPSIQSINRILNSKVTYNGKEITFMKYIQENVDSNFKNYMSTLLINMQGRKTESTKFSKFGKIRGGLAQAALGANVKVFITQATSLPMAFGELGFSNTIQGALSGKVDYKFMTDNDPYFKERFKSGGAGLSYSLLNEESNTVIKNGKKAKSWTEIFTKPINQIDKFTIGRIFNASIANIAKKNGISVKSVKANNDLMLEALKLAEQTTRRTQPNYSVLENGSDIYQADEITKSFLQFTTVGRKYGNNLALHLHDAIVDPSCRANFGKALSGFITAQLLFSLIGSLFKDYLGKLDRDDDESLIDDVALDTLIATVENSTINMVPFVKDIYNKCIKGYDIDYNALGSFNDIVGALSKTDVIFNGTEAQKEKEIYNLAVSTSVLTGIPVKNLTEYTLSTLKNFNVETAIRSQNVLYGVDSSATKTNLVKAYNQNNTSSIVGNLSSILSKANLDTPNNTTSTEIARLYSLGYTNVIPSTSVISITVDGQVYEIKGTALNKFTSTYNKLIQELEDLTSTAKYKRLTDDQKAKAIKQLNSAYYGLSKSQVVSTYEKSKIENALDNIKGSDLVYYLAKIDEFSATRLKTKKEQVLAYINNLRLSTKAKASLLEVVGYTE